MPNETMSRLFSVITIPANPAANIKSLLGALENIKATKQERSKNHGSEQLISLLALANDAAQNINPDSFVNRRKQWEEMESKFKAQGDALDFFSTKFEDQIKDYCKEFPTQTDAVLRDMLQKLEYAQKQQDTEEAAIKERITRIQYFLTMCSSSTQSEVKEGQIKKKQSPRQKK